MKQEIIDESKENKELKRKILVKRLGDIKSGFTRRINTLEKDIKEGKYSEKVTA